MARFRNVFATLWTLIPSIATSLGRVATFGRGRRQRVSCHTDETYLRVPGLWLHLYRIVGKAGNTFDFRLSERGNGPAATRLFAKALSSNGMYSKILIDKNGANAAGIQEGTKVLNRQFSRTTTSGFRMLTELAGNVRPA